MRLDRLQLLDLQDGRSGPRGLERVRGHEPTKIDPPLLLGAWLGDKANAFVEGREDDAPLELRHHLLNTDWCPLVIANGHALSSLRVV